jgi:hypothetical protein
MGYGFIGVEDNVRVETGKVDRLAYSKEAGEYVEDKHRAFFWLGGSEKKEGADEEEKDRTERGDDEDYSQEMV